jgi:DNA replication protein DnaC
VSADLKERLRLLGLGASADRLDDIVASATKKRWGVVDALEHIATLEETDRARRGLDRRTKRSRMGAFKTMADFDWNWPTKIDRPLVESLLTPDFVASGRNVVLASQSGLGKTMIAQNIAHAAILGGHSVLFVSAATSCSTSQARSRRAGSNGACVTTPRWVS